MSSDKVILMPAINYTVANAKKDIGNLDVNLSNYVKKETLEILIESLVSDEELAEKLKDYVNKVFMNNALDDYVTKVLLNEKINNFTTYAYVQDVIDNVSTITDQMLAIETTLTNKSDVEHTHTTTNINDLETLIETKINEAKETIINDAFKTMYPIGSIYISFTPILNLELYPVTADGGTFQVEWNGCIWEFINSDVFLRNATFEIRDVSEYVNPEDENKYRHVISGGGETGGSDTHSHEYGIRYLGWYHQVRGISSDYIQLLDNGTWKTYDEDGTKATTNYSARSGDTGEGNVISCKANVTESSNLPPYLTVYMYKRIA